MKSYRETRHTILLVDDEPTNLQVLKHTLQDRYRLLFARDGAKAIELAGREKIDLVLLDIMMPGMSGYDVCRRLKADPATSGLPVIFITALSDIADEQLGFEIGAVDYITKPFSPVIVSARVRNHLSLVQADTLRQTRLQIVQCLGMAAEYKDNETGMHVVRMSHYTKVLARAAGYSEADAEELLNAAPMHDVGKIGIPDAILRKPGKLEGEEWDVMRSHAEIGAQIIGEHEGGLLRIASVIAIQHHEKWDGSGYPNGLAGDQIDLAARIVAIADVFDALTSVRPYKKAWEVDDALALLKRDAGSHFDPELVPLFMSCMPQVLEIKERWSDKPGMARSLAPLPAPVLSATAA
ncbi:HD-GYP domain-containing protein [Herbaspirillum robiniae]|uniref:Response regulator n=1 Tax=Herbaspirillum robiniae TaxID=2014887 RepID=A0ABX2M1Z7_9BURK|nr:HD domain-containing phosphohydrolase [Herbaspirillum robiniae]NUU03283.1 response regulator [Herbaspirillum robiniae]